MMLKVFFIQIFAGLLIFCNGFAQTIVWDGVNDHLNIGKDVYILKDLEEAFTIDQVSSEAFGEKFVRSERAVLNLGFSSGDIFWIKFSLDYKASDSLWLELAQAHVPITDLYFKNENGKWQTYRAGYKKGLYERLIKHHFQVFPLPETDGSKEFYIRLRNYAYSIPISIWKKDAYEIKANKQKLFYGLYVGILIFAILSNLLLFFSLRSLTIVLRLGYLHYSFIVLMHIFNSAIMTDGYALYLFPKMDLMIWNFFIGPINFPNTLLYGIVFLEVKKYAPKIYKFSIIVFAYLLSYCFGVVFLPIKAIITLNSIHALIALFLAWYLGVITGRKGNRIGYYFATAYFIYFGLICLEFIYVETGKPSYLLEFSHVSVAMFFEVMILAFLLFKRFEWERVAIEKEKMEALKFQEINEVKTRLYTNITHEFRTPLTIINGMAGQLQNRVGQSAKESLKMILRNGRQLLRLVNQMLDLAKLESGMLPVHKVQGDIIQYLRYLTESFQSYAESRDISLHFLTDPEEYVMDYDQEKVMHIVSNLLSNAIKFTPPNGNIYLQLSEVVQGQALFLQIVVKDSGIGIAEDQLPHIFSRFFQGDISPIRQNEGTGIGLALTKELVNLLGGRIEVSSKVGEGSTFKVLLPVVKESPRASALADLEELASAVLAFTEEAAPEAAANISAPSKSVGRPLLLIIEDNQDVVRYLTTCLQDAYQLTAANDGQAGIDKAIELVPDIIISDVMMPKKDGFQVCNTLKNDERTSHIPIVMLTAKADVQSKIAGLKRGADAYLPKPFHPEELSAQLSNLIEQQKKLQKRYQGTAPPKETADAATEIEDAFLKKIGTLVEEHMADRDFDITWLAYRAGMSRVQLFRKLKALTDLSPSVFVRTIRLQKAKHLLLGTELNVSEIAYETGFGDPASFSRVFREQYGQSPTEMRGEGI